MGKQHTPRTLQERRNHPRFSLHYPARITLCGENSSKEFQAVSQNLSVQGILLRAKTRVPKGCEVSFVIKVQEDYLVRPIWFTGKGKVVRVESSRSETGLSIAVMCSRSISKTTRSSHAVSK